MTGTATATRAGRWTVILDGHRLRELRREQGFSRAELAAHAGVSRTTVARLERHAHPPCRTWTMARLAAALGEGPAAIVAAVAPDSVTRIDTIR